MNTPLKEEETITMTTRPHWSTLVVPFLVSLVAIVIGVVCGGWGYVACGAGVGFFLYRLLERNRKIWVVTNLRVIVEWGVLSKQSKESPLDKINNVSYNQSLLGRILRYGSIQIQTAAEIGSTTYTNIENPKKLRDTITCMQEEYKNYQIKKQAKELANSILGAEKPQTVTISSELEKLYNLKQNGVLTEQEFEALKAKILQL
ncbi:MAG: PH domain-containing protein [Dysgonamonadaceae bacterium]|jgi:uncharacterized membrane protein YdbT with pleckstrin-like domain|nr:PH domain-containing protein [Dysgonamonadaceae bacterium]